MWDSEWTNARAGRDDGQQRIAAMGFSRGSAVEQISRRKRAQLLGVRLSLGYAGLAHNERPSGYSKDGGGGRNLHRSRRAECSTWVQ
jgi:hypothetical protein